MNKEKVTAGVLEYWSDGFRTPILHYSITPVLQLFPEEFLCPTTKKSFTRNNAAAR